MIFTPLADAISFETTARRAIRGGMVVFALVVAVVGPGCSENDPAGPPPVPVVTSVSPATAAPGDTVSVRGKNFLTPASENRVFFNNPFGSTRPFSATSTALAVVVPGNAASGPVSVAVTGQYAAGVGPAVQITRGIGDVWVFGGASANYVLELPHPNPNAEYLLIPHSTNAGTPYTQVHSYSINPEAVSPTQAAPKAQARARNTMTIREKFDLALRGTVEQLAAVYGDAVLEPPKPPERARAPRQFAQFFVYHTGDPDSSTLDPDNYTRVTAQLRHTGDFCLLYSDVDTLASGNMTLTDIEALGNVFDLQIRVTNTTYFGVETDIDGNGRVIVLITPVVNRLTPKGSGSFIGGFFSPVDLFPTSNEVPHGTTNEAEIFYVLAADPGGFWSLPYSESRVVDENTKTIAHEYQHLISFSYRLSIYGLGFIQSTWLEEGMSHMAEDLNSINSGNVARASAYLADPGNVSLEHNQAPIEQRGGIYLFLRYLGDRYDETIYKSLLQSKCVGRPCIETITGENFYETIGDFLATLYLSGKGITASELYNYASINLADFQAVGVTSRWVDDGPVGGTIFRTSGDFYLFKNNTTTTNSFYMLNSTGAGLRTVVVRTR